MRRMIVLITLSIAMTLVSASDLFGGTLCSATGILGNSCTVQTECTGVATCTPGFFVPSCECDMTGVSTFVKNPNSDLEAADNIKIYVSNKGLTSFANSIQLVIDTFLTGSDQDYSDAENNFVLEKSSLSSSDYNDLDNWLISNGYNGL